jgi:hypothetical protein
MRALLRAGEGDQIYRVVNNVMNWDTDFDDEVTRLHQPPVETFTHHLAVTHAMADGSPRLIARQTTMFIATPAGEVWQVFDSDAISWADGGLPRNDAEVVARIFVRAGSGGRTSRIYRFGIGESRSVTAWRMMEQLERAMIGDDRAA